MGIRLPRRTDGRQGRERFDFYFDKPTNTLLPEQANFEHGTGLKRTCKVGSYTPNRLGLYDMHGNVVEWCEDVVGFDVAARRALRGGSWGHDPSDCRATRPPPRSPRGEAWMPGVRLRLARVRGQGDCEDATEGTEAAATGQERPVAKHTNKQGMEFVLVPKGKSWLGGGGGKPGDKEVEIPYDFYLGKYEVTQEEWEKVMGNKPSHFSRTGAGKDAVKDIPDADLKRFPVEKVSWDERRYSSGG